MSSSSTHSYDFDLFCIGAGSGGVRASRFSATNYQKKVAIAEESRYGGTCVIRGCVPKKLLVYASHFADEFKDALGFGWSDAHHDFSWRTLIENKNKEIDRLEGVYRRLLANSGVTLIDGRARLVDEHTVQVGDKTYTAEHILVATGARPQLPDVPGIEHVITSNEALEMFDQPKHIVIVGGGYIACEFAGIFNNLGSKVTLIIRGENVLRGFDEDIAKTLRAEMEKKGIRVIDRTKIEKIEKLESGVHDVYLSCGSVLNDADLVFYATGRVPNTKGLGLEEVGVKMGPKGQIIVDDFSRTNVASITAIGDVTDRVQLTPVALAEGMALAKTLWEGVPTPVNYNNIPSAVFSQPPIGTVGLTEQQVRELGRPYEAFVSTFKPMKYTLSGRDEKTFMKLLVDQETQKVLGCHMCGQDAPEIIQGFAVALVCGATKQQFDATVGIHPSAAEEFVTMRTARPTPKIVS